MKKRRRRNNSTLIQSIIILILITAIIVVVIQLLKPSGNLPSGADQSSISSETSSEETSGQSQISAMPTAAEPTPSGSFWGNSIDLTVSPEQIDVPGKYPKWPSQPGFDVPGHDLSIFKANADADKPLTGAVVFIDPGHGGEDLGAVYPRHPVKPEIIESRINLSVAFTLKELLEDAGAKVVLTREDDYFYRLYYRSAVVAKNILEDFQSKLSADSPNKHIIAEYISEMDETIERNDHDDPADIFYPKGVDPVIRNILDIQSGYSNCIFLSLHCNAAAEPDTLKGTKVYYATNASVYNMQVSSSKDIVKPEYQNFNDTERQRLANIIYSNITGDLPGMTYFDPDEAVQATDYSVIRETNLVSALIEMGFVNHTEDREVLLQPANQEKYAQAIYRSIIEYFCG